MPRHMDRRVLDKGWYLVQSRKFRGALSVITRVDLQLCLDLSPSGAQLTMHWLDRLLDCLPVGFQGRLSGLPVGFERALDGLDVGFDGIGPSGLDGGIVMPQVMDVVVSSSDAFLEPG